MTAAVQTPKLRKDTKDALVPPFLAKDTGFTNADLDLLWQALSSQMWEIDRSASRGFMATRGLYVFEHASPLGSTSAHELFDRVSVKPIGSEGDEKPPRSFDDYKSRLNIQDTNLPTGVTLNRLVG